MPAVDASVKALVRGVLERHSRSAGHRLLVAIAGAPGSGKSTLTDAAALAINRVNPGLAAVFPMDGYHFDDRLLDVMGRRLRKGAPDTFDVHGLRHMLERLKANREDAIAVPVFDRQIEIARAGASLIPREVGIVLCEGNYLLLQQSPWDSLKPLFDFTVLVDVDEAELRQRLTARWQGYGLPPDEIRFKVEENDLPNGVAIVTSSFAPDLNLRN